ncbi:MAG: OmpH family outer membrane protein [Deltaproteobacteria bacterium]|jgi:outer membrane protein|nr:OmpH family outer membrane protein [Deltaproteobacteria bacterium]
MSNIVKIFLATFFLFGSWNFAYGADVAKIGVVDFQKIIEKSDMGKASSETIKGRGNEMTATLKEKEAEIEKTKKELDQKSLVMNKDASEEQEQALRNKINDLASLQRRYSRELKELQNNLLGKLENDLKGIIEEIGKKEGYTLIMERRVGGVMYAPSTIDITDRVIRKLNALSTEDGDKKKGKK